MALQFQPPNDIINAYLNRPNPVLQGLDAVGKAADTIRGYQLQNQQMKLHGIESLAGLYGNGGEWLANQLGPQVAKTTGIEMPGYQSPPITPQATPTVFHPDDPSGVIHASVSSGHPDTLGLYSSNQPGSYSSSQPGLNGAQGMNDFMTSHPGVGGKMLTNQMGLAKGMGELEMQPVTKAEKELEIQDLKRKLNSPLHPPQVLGTQGNTVTVLDPDTGTTKAVALPKNGPLQTKDAPPLPDKAVEDMSGVNTVLNNMRVLKQNYDPSFIGPTASKYEQAKLGLNLPGKFAGNPKAAKFFQAHSAITNALAHQKFGARLTDTEINRLAKEFPTPGTGNVDFVNGLNSFENLFKTGVNDTQNFYKQGGYKQLPTFNTDTGPSLGSNNTTLPTGMVTIKDSQGTTHMLPQGSLDAAKQRDPGLQVIANGN